MNSETAASIHNVTNIKPLINHFSNFSTYEWIATDIHGAKLKITFFHTHCDALVVEPTITRVIEKPENLYENVTPTL